jgi:hypothetical protein
MLFNLLVPAITSLSDLVLHHCHVALLTLVVCWCVGRWLQDLEREHESRVASMRSEFGTAQRRLSDRLANQEDAVRLLQDQLASERRRADSAQTDRERVRQCVSVSVCHAPTPNWSLRCDQIPNQFINHLLVSFASS